VNELQVTAALLVLALAAFVQGVFGLGFAMIATPLLALFLDYQTAVMVAAVPLLVLALYWLAVNRPYLHVALQVSLPQQVSLLLLAALILFSVVLPLIQSRWVSASPAVSVRRAPWFGLLAGVTEAALNVGAPFMVLFAGLARLSRLQMLIALNICFALGKSIQIGLLIIVAPVAVSLELLAAGVLMSLLAFRIGDRIAGRLSEAGFQAWLRIFLLAIATLLVIRSQFVT
jgi:uncharacterized membrane protein YfcA